jgi:hypothetical protein
VQFAVGFAQLNVATEVAFGPGRQGRSQVGQGQLALQGVDQQGDQQDQADHHALHQAHFALDLSVLGAHHRLRPAIACCTAVIFRWVAARSARFWICSRVRAVPPGSG